MTKIQKRLGHLKFGIWNLFGYWNLSFVLITMGSRASPPLLGSAEDKAMVA
jgi:hypothetical protein